MTVEVGQRYRTPFDPSGIVEVLELEGPHPASGQPTVRVRFIGDHPHGYADGTEGRYFTADLRPLVETETLREALAALEHDQWIAWSRDIAATEQITPARLARWQQLWRPYAELTEAEKEQDREWADKVLTLVAAHSPAVVEAKQRFHTRLDEVRKENQS